MIKKTYLCDECKKELGEVRVCINIADYICVTCYMKSPEKFDDIIVQWRGMDQPDDWVVIKPRVDYKSKKEELLILSVSSEDYNKLKGDDYENWDVELVGVGGPKTSKHANFISANEPSGGPSQPNLIYQPGKDKRWTAMVLKKMRKLTPSLTWRYKTVTFV